MTLTELTAGLSASRRSKIPAKTLMSLFGHSNRLAEVLEIPEIDCYKFELAFPPARADLIILHRDDSATLVNLQGEVGKRELSAAIPQLVRQGHRIKGGYTVPRLRLILAATVPGAGHVDIAELCEIAGVKFVPLGSAAEHLAAMKGDGHRGEAEEVVTHGSR